MGPFPWLTSSGHQTTGYFAGQPVYIWHFGYFVFHGACGTLLNVSPLTMPAAHAGGTASAEQVSTIWKSGVTQPLRLRISSRKPTEPRLWFCGAASGPIGLPVSFSPTTKMAATGLFMQAGRVRSPPPICMPKARTLSAFVQPDTAASQAPLL